MERPTAVRIGIGAYMAYLILGVISAAVTFSDMNALIEQAMTQARAQGADVVLTPDAARALVITVGVVQLVFVGLVAMFIWFAWNGRNWARIVLWVIGGFGVIGGLFTLSGAGTPTSGFLSTLGVFQFLLVLVGVVALALKPSNDWYRYRRWARASGHGR
jgi:hypothetical protein